MKFPAAVWAAVVCLLLLAGCGGGEAGLDPLPQMTRVSVSVNWPAQNRAVAVPANCRSVVLTVKGADAFGGDFVFSINRGGNPSAFSQTYTSPALAKVGTWEVRVQCHAEENAAGPVVGTAVATATIAPDGSGIANIDASGGSISVSISPPSETLFIGQSKTFTAAVTGTDDEGVIWSVQEGASGGAITDGGRYTTPSLPGTYHVVAASRADPSKKAVATVTVRPGDAPTGDLPVGVE